MDEIWERAVETALDGQTDVNSVRTLTLDGAVKCLHGRLPPPALFEKFQSLQHLSIANIGVSSLEQFPRLQSLQRLILSDNRIAGGLKFLVETGLESLRDLDLSNNRISDINDLRPLADLRLVSLDLYECPVTRIKDYRSRVFGLIRSLKYLDKTDAEGNERPESDDEDDEEEEDEDDDDPGSGEIDGEDRPFRLNNGHRAGNEGVVDVDEDEESDADEEEADTSRGVNVLSNGGNPTNHHSNGFRVEAVNAEDDDGGDDDSVEEVYGDEVGDDEDVVEAHESDDSDDDNGVDEEEDEEDDDEEEVDNDEGDLGEAASTGRLTSTEGEIDGHEQGEDDVDEDDNGETGEEEEAVEEDGDFENDEEAEDEEGDYGTGYLVQPVGQVEVSDGGDLNTVNDAELEDDVDEDGEVQELPPAASHKRKRNDDDEDDGDEDDDGDLNSRKSSKHH